MLEFDPQAKPFYIDSYQDNEKEKREIRSAILYLFSDKSQFMNKNRLAANYVDLARVLRTKRLDPYSIELLLDVVHDLVYVEKRLEYHETLLQIRSIS